MRWSKRCVPRQPAPEIGASPRLCRTSPCAQAEECNCGTVKVGARCVGDAAFEYRFPYEFAAIKVQDKVSGCGGFPMPVNLVVTCAYTAVRRPVSCSKCHQIM